MTKKSVEQKRDESSWNFPKQFPKRRTWTLDDPYTWVDDGQDELPVEELR